VWRSISGGFLSVPFDFARKITRQQPCGGRIETTNYASTMKRSLTRSIAFLFVGLVSGAENYPGGIVYGPKAAFNISAPAGWVLDNESGVQQGLPCVLYPKGESWADARTIMYAKIASTQFEDVNTFVAMAIKEMKAKQGMPKEKVASGKTRDGHDYFINEYPATQTYSQWERVAYVQLPHAVAYIVLSSRDRASYTKDSAALEETLKKTSVYLEPKSVPSPH
jgi:hypothetical protein